MPRHALEYIYDQSSSQTPSENHPKRKKRKIEKEKAPFSLFRRQNLTAHDCHFLHRPVRLARLDVAHPLHDIHTVDHVSENSVGAVEMPRRSESNKELRAIGVRTCIRHAQDASGGVRELRDDFIGKSATVDGGASAAGAGGVAGLDHEVADDAVAGNGVVVAGGGEDGEVVACLLEVLDVI